ncbi:hypothetical protein [Streptomyces sp. UH6]|uniref:hypothetical protein n=1 Tax=Streptomyces sp. UH6 TaxID=2748379 RepID=UPI0015D4C483|nr:hypothetical protein [Streptomyces sp. UH6]NYV75861.1 hypothetical protein [Streptomyces sp. UH6]
MAGSPYRYSFPFIDRWEKRLTRMILIGFGAGALLVLIALGVGASLDGRVPDDDPLWMWAWGLLIAGAVVAGGLGILVPLLLGCVMGGLSLHPKGWAPGLVLYLGVLAFAVGAALDDAYLGDLLDTWLAPAGLVALVVGTVWFRVLGRRRGVPLSGGRVHGTDDPA